jgi:hypothetical protein
MRVILLTEFGRLRHDKPTGAEPEVKRLIDIPALFEKLVLPHDTHVGSPVLDVGRNVCRPEYEESEVPIAVLADQAARIEKSPHTRDANLLKQFNSRGQQPTLRQRDGNHLGLSFIQ